MYELLIALPLFLLFFGYCSNWSNPVKEVSVKDIKPVVDLLLQSGYSPQKAIEIIGFYD
jgi:hypothetical protein